MVKEVTLLYGTSHNLKFVLRENNDQINTYQLIVSYDISYPCYVDIRYTLLGQIKRFYRFIEKKQINRVDVLNYSINIKEIYPNGKLILEIQQISMVKNNSNYLSQQTSKSITLDGHTKFYAPYHTLHYNEGKFDVKKKNIERKTNETEIKLIDSYFKNIVVDTYNGQWKYFIHDGKNIKQIIDNVDSSLIQFDTSQYLSTNVDTNIDTNIDTTNTNQRFKCCCSF